MQQHSLVCSLWLHISDSFSLSIPFLLWLLCHSPPDVDYHSRCI
ncbi:hypothetical protein NC653_008085 [Populus alba x Populus x berolinensis]|uniref:Uncharacterized protein n=1 Tax=Populus alba x Populus x berolinensis TaxID=444605 RepID=A0AAD6W9J4_9ROSI|nr:hypothetical protein NC653_008085 [Populus alba x Populus x berolinensis]